MSPPLVLDLDGPLRLLRADGTEVTPAGGMLRAMLAALGVAPRRRLGRDALKALLWPDRMPEQADDSLRRATSDLRRAMGAHRAGLRTGAGWIDLDPEIVEVRLPADAAALAQDVSVRTPGFDDWLQERRERLAAPAPVATAHLALALPEPGTGGHAICDVVLRAACRRAGLWREVRVVPAGRAGAGPEVMHLSCLALPSGGDEIVLEASVTQGGVPLWSRLEAASEADLTEVASRITSEMTRTLIGAAAEAITDITSYEHARVLRATGWLRADVSLKPAVRGAFLGYARLAAWADRHEGDEALEEAHASALDALRGAPGEPVAGAAAALVLQVRHDVGLARDVAWRAMRQDPFDDLVRYALATTHARPGVVTAETRQAARAVALSGAAVVSDGSTAMTGAMTALAMGDEAQALAWAQRAWLLAPDSRPAMRHVAALAYRAGDEETALQALRALEVAEPGFSAAAMAERDYPVDTMRAAELLDVAWARHLGGARRGDGARRRGGGRA